MYTQVELVALIRDSLENRRGDDLYRARAAFRNCTPAQMQEQYGQSGKTRQQIIEEYEAYDRKWIAAKNLFESLVSGVKP